MADYLIKGKTLTAIADKIRVYTTTIGNSTHTIDTSVIESGSKFIQGAVQVYYHEDVDSDHLNVADYSDPEGYHGGVGEFKYLENLEGNIVPVIYMDENVGDFTEPYFYLGVDIINGEIYDKWRKIELTDADGGEATDEYNYTWTSDAKNYIYTNRIVICTNDEDELISPSDFPNQIEEVYNKGYRDGSGATVSIINYDSETQTLSIDTTDGE